MDLTEVPYDGTGPALTDLVGGQVDFMCDQTTNTAGQIQSGDIKGYAVTTPEPVEALPDLPDDGRGGPARRRGQRVARALRPGRDPRRDRREADRRPRRWRWPDQDVIDQMADLGTTPVPPRTW